MSAEELVLKVQEMLENCKNDVVRMVKDWAAEHEGKSEVTAEKSE